MRRLLTLSRRRRREGGPRPPGRMGRAAQSAALTLAVGAILVMANILAARHNVRWDTTAEQVFALSDTTQEVLGRAGDPVRIYAFLDPDSAQSTQVLDLLREYSRASGGRISYERVNPYTQPSLVQRFSVSELGTLVLESGERTEKVDPWDMMGDSDPLGVAGFAGEEALTNALFRLDQARRPEVYFLEGHNERSPDQDLYDVRRALETQGYSVMPLNLALTPEVPDGADLVVIAGPQRDLAPADLAALQRHAGRGGNLLVLADPLPESAGLPHLRSLLADWGLDLADGVVVDPERNYMLDPAAAIPAYLMHDITDRLEAAHLAMVLPGVRPVRTVPAPSGTPRQWPLLQSSPAAWADADLRAPVFDPATDKRGVRALAYAAELDTPGAGEPARLVLAGSAAFMADNAAAIQGNLDFFLGAVRWSTGHGEPRLHISPRQRTRRDLLLSGRDVAFVFWSTVAGLPLVVLAGGGMIWWRRRHL